jgi:catechol 2,3-dioxygenase-like lactoylglutathione lyase family enzyme
VRLSTITVWVEDPRALRDWYMSHLDFVLLQETPRFVLLAEDASATCIGFHIGDPLATPERLQFHLEVDDVDATYERLVAEGLEFEGPPQDRPWGVRSTATTDPAGHSVEITTPFRATPGS